MDESQDPRYLLAFPDLDPGQIAALEPFGTRKSVAKGEFVWRAGQADLCMYVVLDGEMHILDGRTGALIATHKKGSFSGDIDLLSGRAAVVTAQAGTDLELLEIPNDCVRAIVSERPELSEIMIRAFLARRALLVESGRTGVLIAGSRYCPETLRIREFLVRNQYPIVWDDLEDNPNTVKVLEELHVTEHDTPVVVLPNGKVLKKPTNEELAECLGIRRLAQSKIYDLVIVGAGPAGLAAAVYGASEGLSTLLVDAMAPGGQAGSSSRIENYMGFPSGLTGQQLAEGGLIQAEKFGAEMVVPAQVTGIDCRPSGGHATEIEGLGTVESKCVILASGAKYRKLDIPTFEAFEGRGIYFSATHLEQVYCAGSQVVVVGGGNSAGQAAVFLATTALKVSLIVRADDLYAGMSSYLARRIEQTANIELCTSCQISELHGNGYLEAATIVNRRTGEARKEDTSALFVMIGAVPHTHWLPDDIRRDSKGFIMTGPEVSRGWPETRPPYFLETSCPGVFAAGDARANSIKRVASAVGEGSMAVAFVHQFLASHSFQWDIPQRPQPALAV